MSHEPPPRRGPVTPEAYARWRGSDLGSITEARELEVVFGLTGPLGGRRLLDVGCGDGRYLVEAARRGAIPTGVDESGSMLLAARARAAGHRVPVHLHRGDARALPFDDATFDVVIGVTVLCFVPNAADAVAEMARVLAPGGRLVVGELGRVSWWAAWRRVRGWLGSPTWMHATFRSARELADLAAGAGLLPDDTRGAVYYPPLGCAARRLGRMDARVGALTTAGAAFVALAATKPVSR